MKRISVWLLVLISFCSCTSNVEKPKNLLDEEKMTEILADLFIHQQSSYLTEVNSTKYNFSQIDAQILHNHQTNAEDFRESYKYYYLQPEKYNEILLDVREKLEEKLPKEEREKRIADRKEKEKKK